MKYKKVEKNFYNVICDKVTRFEPAYIRFEKLYSTILSRYYFETDVKKVSYTDKIKIASRIINESSKEDEFDIKLNNYFAKLEKYYFFENELSDLFLSCRLNLTNMVLSLDINKIKQKNVLWLYNLCKNKSDLNFDTVNINTLLPVKKIILCEGQTEYILLETLFRLFGVDFNIFGVYIIPAGGKNQVVRKYYSMLESYKIPFFILLDSDANQIKTQITCKLRPEDKLYIIKSGEFEDLIPSDIIKATLNHVHKNDFNCKEEDFCNTEKMVKNIEQIYRKYGFGEFKKAQFASYLNDYISKNCTKIDFDNSEIVDIVNSFINF